MPSKITENFKRRMHAEPEHGVAWNKTVSTGGENIDEPVPYITLETGGKNVSSCTIKCGIPAKANTDLQNYKIDGFYYCNLFYHIYLSPHIQWTDTSHGFTVFSFLINYFYYFISTRFYYMSVTCQVPLLKYSICIILLYQTIRIQLSLKK